MTNTAADGSHTVTTYQYGRRVSETSYDALNNQVYGTAYGYDAHGRQSTATDARNGATIYAYNPADLVTSATTPSPGTLGSGPQVTTTSYDAMLRATNVVNPDGASVTTIYTLTGQIGETFGSRIYPVGYSYDYDDRVTTMTNWANFAAGTGSRVTTWTYDAQRGWLTNKAYADGTGPSYTFTRAGRLKTRAWARGIMTTNYYDNGGSLLATAYSDGITPSLTYTMDRLGRQASIAQAGSITTSFIYNTANQVLSESYSAGILSGLMVTNTFDQFLRRTNLSSLSGSTLLTTAIYGYDAASRMQTVSDGAGNSATYSYVANSPSVSQILFTNSGALRMMTTKQYDYLNRLTAISSLSSASSTNSFAYTYNNANERSRTRLADGSYWQYMYDTLGQVVSGHKFWSDESPVAGQQFDYTFDTIGNRTQTLAGGDQNGWNQRLAAYTANNLNQYTQRTVPGDVDIMGLSLATNAVTVNGTTAYEKGEYFRDQLPINNSSAAVWTNITVAAAGQPSVSGSLFVAKTPEVFGYDADGNMTNDGRWSYTWDGENRLINMTSLSTAPASSLLKLDFTYDWQGRRIQKIVSTNNGTAYGPSSTNRFVYDLSAEASAPAGGWNVILELGTPNTALRTYLWGTDLSGSAQGAGGVGGLLQESYYGSQTTNCFAAFDGNGNVAALVNATDGTLDAQYEYGPFGELLRATGPMAKANPFRFSTKYGEDESDFLYYGYRFYSPSTGRWLSRDPIAEKGGPNLYGFLSNNALTSADYAGLIVCSYHCEDPTISVTKGTNPLLPPYFVIFATYMCHCTGASASGWPRFIAIPCVLCKPYCPNTTTTTRTTFTLGGTPPTIPGDIYIHVP